MTTRLILAGVGAVIALAGWLWRRDALARWAAAPAPEGAKPKKKPRLPTAVMLLGLWLLIVKVLSWPSASRNGAASTWISGRSAWTWAASA